MSDIIDDGCDREQRDRDLRIAAARIIAKSRELQPAGVCYNCHDPLDNGERFFSSGIEYDFEAEHELIKQCQCDDGIHMDCEKQRPLDTNYAD